MVLRLGLDARGERAKEELKLAEKYKEVRVVDNGGRSSNGEITW